MKVARSIEIAADPETIYAIVMNPRRLEDWVTIHQELVAAPTGNLRKGSRLTQTLKLAGRRFKVDWHVVANDRARHIVWQGAGPVRSRAMVTYDLTPKKHGTHFSYVNEYELPGGPLGKMAGPAVRRVTGGELERSLEKLKALAEAG